MTYCVEAMGLTPDGWGPYFWATIHLTALGAPSTIDTMYGSGYRSFYNSLPWIIPCSSCADHLKETLKKLPLTEEVLKGNSALFEWTVKLHNEVNGLLGKKTVSQEEAKGFWTRVAENAYPPFRQESSQPKNGTKITGWFIAILLLNIFAWFWFSKKTQKRRI